MTIQPTLIPWVELFRGAVGFGVQTFALDSDPQPSKTVIAAGQLVDELGFDAFSSATILATRLRPGFTSRRSW